MMIDVGSAAAGRPQDRPRSRRTRQTQSRNAVGFPRRRIRRRSFQFLLVTRNVRGIPVYFLFLSLFLSTIWCLTSLSSLYTTQYRGALRGLQVRHPHPEDRQLLQSLYVSCIIQFTRLSILFDLGNVRDIPY